MRDVLRRALEPVLRDIDAFEVSSPLVGDQDWAHDPGIASAMLGSPAGYGFGVSVIVDAPEPERLAHVADKVQEWVIEELVVDGGRDELATGPQSPGPPPDARPGRRGHHDVVLPHRRDPGRGRRCAAPV